MIPFEVLEAPGVSTHSRPKAAGVKSTARMAGFLCFNSQPPEGGWDCIGHRRRLGFMFQLTAARRRLDHGRKTL